MNILNRFSYIVSFTIALLLWEWSSGEILPGPVSVFNTLGFLLIDDHFHKDVLYSLMRLFIGFITGSVLGIVIGTAIGYIEIIRSLLFPVIKFVITIPKIAFLPLFIILLGIGELSKITIITLGVFFPVMMVTFSSVQRVPRDLIEASCLLGAGPARILRLVVVPYALPNIINSGLRLGISLGLVLLVASEMIASKYGLGNFIYYTGNDLLLDKMLSGILVLGTIGLILNRIIDFIHAYLCDWSIESEGL